MVYVSVSGSITIVREGRTRLRFVARLGGEESETPAVAVLRVPAGGFRAFRFEGGIINPWA